MKRFFFIWLFIPFISYCQNDNEFKLQNIKEIEWKKNICISKDDCFYLKPDRELFYVFLYYSHRNEIKQMIDSAEYNSLLYGDQLCSFEYQRDNSHVVLWEIQGEYSPTFYFYYLKDGNIMKIGEWDFFEPCDTCDVFHYSVNDIRIFHKNDEIEFLFLKETRFFAGKENYDYDYDYDYNDWGLFKAGELVVSFNIGDGTVRRVEKRK